MNDAALSALYQEALAARSHAGRASCPEPERLAALVERRGPEPERLATLDHAAGCAACLRELELLRALRVGIPALRAWRLPAAIAASVLIVLAGAVVGVRMLRRGAADVVRDAASPGIALVTSAPARTLAWHPVPHVLAYDVEVTTEGGDLVLARSTGDTTLALPDSLRLDPQVHYLWWVRARRSDGTELRSRVVPLSERP